MTDLESEYYDARRNFRELRQKIKDEKREVLKIASDNADRFMELVYGQTLQELKQKEESCLVSFDEERESRAVQGVNAPFPIGTKMMKGVKFHREYGVVEPVTRTTKFQRNISPYRKPEVGTFIIRTLKVDGTPSLRFEDSFNRWFFNTD